MRKFTQNNGKTHCKKVMALLLSVVMMAGTMSGCGDKKDDEDDREDIYTGFIQHVSTDEYEYDEYGDHLELNYYDFADKEEVEFPAEIDGKKVTVISEDFRFDRWEKAKKIVIPDTMEKIFGNRIAGSYGKRAFSGVEEVIIPDSVNEMGPLFCGSSWYKSLDDEFVVVGDGILIKYNGDDTEVEIPDNVKCIAKFDGNRNEIEKIEIPDSVEIIGEEAFSGMNSLTTINIPDSVKIIHRAAFENTGWLKNQEEGPIIVGDGVFLGWLFNKDGVIGEDILKDGVVEIPDNVKYVTSLYADYEFYSHGKVGYKLARQIKEVYLPSACTVDTWLMMELLEFCPTIKVGNKMIKRDGDYYSSFNENYIGKEYLRASHECYEIVLDDDIIGIYGGRSTIGLLKGAFEGNEADIIELPDKLKYIGPKAFSSSKYITTLTIPGSVEIIGEGAFGNCPKLESIVIENGVEKLPDDFCSNCESLKSVTIPESVTEIGERAFLVSQEKENEEDENEESIYKAPEELVIHGKKGSYAETYAKENGITFEAK